MMMMILFNYYRPLNVKFPHSFTSHGFEHFGNSVLSSWSPRHRFDSWVCLFGTFFSLSQIRQNLGKSSNAFEYRLAWLIFKIRPLFFLLLLLSASFAAKKPTVLFLLLHTEQLIPLWYSSSFLQHTKNSMKSQRTLFQLVECLNFPSECIKHLLKWVNVD